MQSLKQLFARTGAFEEWTAPAQLAAPFDVIERCRLVTPCELEAHPALARGILLVPALSGWLPALNTCQSADDLMDLLSDSCIYANHPHSVIACKDILFRWIYAQPAIKNERANELMLKALCDEDDCDDHADDDDPTHDSTAAEQVTLWDEMMISLWAGKHGRPVSLRHAAIEALFLRVLLEMPWEQITRRVCPCGNDHVPGLIKMSCQPKLETEVRMLKRLLEQANITLSLDRLIYMEP